MFKQISVLSMKGISNTHEYEQYCKGFVTIQAYNSTGQVIDTIVVSKTDLNKVNYHDEAISSQIIYERLIALS